MKNSQLLILTCLVSTLPHLASANCALTWEGQLPNGHEFLENFRKRADRLGYSIVRESTGGGDLHVSFDFIPLSGSKTREASEYREAAVEVDVRYQTSYGASVNYRSSMTCKPRSNLRKCYKRLMKLTKKALPKARTVCR